MAAIRSRLHKQLLRISGHYRHKRPEHRILETLCDVFNAGGTRSLHNISHRQHQVFRNVAHPSSACHQRKQSSQTESPHIDSLHTPYRLVEDELKSLRGKIMKEMTRNNNDLHDIASYYFDGKGKAFRPMVVMLMARACNIHNNLGNSVLPAQEQVGMIAEMIHTASLVHDDVIDAADTRRNKPSVNKVWGQRKAILAGDYILSIASMALARLRSEEVVSILSQVIEDLVRGEFMQLGSKEQENERFAHYLKKTFKKTASLLANSCKAVAVLGNCSEDIVEVAYQYGRNVGIAFQLVDDLLDFVSCEKLLGKPTAADLKLGLATAPVLFAAQSYPELNAMIMRRFTHDGDVETARELVAKSDGVEQTRLLAEQHSLEAVRQSRHLASSPLQASLAEVAAILLRRTK